MKHILISLIIFFLGLFFVSCEVDDGMPTMGTIGSQNSTEFSSPQPLNKTWKSAIEELGLKFQSSFENGDVDGVMSCFWNSPDVILVLENGQVVRGWDNIRMGVQNTIENTDARSVVVDEVEQFRLGENVYSVGTATWTITPKGGTEFSYTERWTDVIRKVSGQWVYLVDHAHDLTPFGG